MPPAKTSRIPIPSVVAKTFLGYDFFLSYCQEDARAYAEVLEIKLDGMGFATFRDNRDIDPGMSLSETIRRAILKSRCILLLDTPGARRSKWVQTEIRQYLEAGGRTIIRINLSGHSDQFAWEGIQLSESYILQDTVWIDESFSAVRAANPSDSVLHEIERRVTGVRRRTVLRSIVVGTFLLLIALLTASVIQTREARRQSVEADKQRQLAASAEQQALNARDEAVASKNEAVQAQREAERRRVEADQQKQLAINNESRAVEALGAAMAGQREENVSTALLLAIEAMRRHPDSSAMEFVRENFRLLPKVAGWFPFGGSEIPTAFSPDNKYLATGHKQRLDVWDVDDLRRTVYGFDLRGDVIDVGFTSNGKVRALVRHDHGFQVIEGNPPTPIRDIPDQPDALGQINSVLTDNAQKVVTQDDFGKRCSLDLNSEDPITCRSSGGDESGWDWSDIANQLHRPSRYVAKYSEDGKFIRVSEIKSDKELKLVPIDESLALHGSCSVSRSGRWLVALGDAAYVFDLQSDDSKPIPLVVQHAPLSGSETDERAVSYKGEIVDLEFSPDETKLATASSDSTVRIWGLSDNAGFELYRVVQHGSFTSVSFSPNGKLIVAHNASEPLELWNVSDPSLENVSLVNAMAVSDRRPRRYLAMATSEDSTSVWNLETKQLVKHTHAVGVTTMAFLPHSDSLVFATKTGQLYLMRDGNQIREITRRYHGPSINKIVVSSTGSHVASIDDEGTVRLWDVATLSEKAKWQNLPKNGPIAISPNGQYVVVARGDTSPYYHGQLQILNSTHRDERKQFQMSFVPRTLAFSPDGSRFVAGEREGILAAWNFSDGRLSAKHALPRVLTYINQVTFSSNGRYLELQGGGSLKMIAIATSEVLDGGRYEAEGIEAFSPDARFFAAIGETERLVELDVLPEDLARTACSRISNNLSRGEWKAFFGNEPYRNTCPEVPESSIISTPHFD